MQGDRPWISTDCVVFDERGRVLLIRRKNEPFKGRYAFPGALIPIGCISCVAFFAVQIPMHPRAIRTFVLLRRLMSTPNDTSFMSCQVCLFGSGRIYQAQLGVAFTHAEGN